MPDFSDFKTVNRLLKEVQDNEQNNRELVDEDHKFIDETNGQWEQDWFDKNDGKPRYTFDQTSPIVDQIAGDIEDSDFDIKIDPAGVGATKEQAVLRDGITRNIENISNAQYIYSNAGRNVATGGLDHWMVVSEFVNDTSFDQDIVIKPIHDSWNRVWFDVGSQEQDRSDSNYGFLLASIPKEEFEEKFPKATGSSVSDGSSNTNDRCHQIDTVIIGHIFFRKLKDRELVKTSLGRVFENDKKFKKNQSKILGTNETIKDTRTVKDSTFFMRKFDADGWLAKEEETVFSTIPLVAVYGNFKVIDNNTRYRGVVRKLKDPQRVYNYAKSREIEEGALAPRAKYWMTREQSEGDDIQKTLRTLNINHDPVQFYNHQEGVPIPQQNGGAQINAGLTTTADTMRQLMSTTAGIFAAGMGDTPDFAQSGVAIGKLQSKSNNITTKYFKSIEIGVRYTCQLINDAMHKVYDGTRMQRIAGADGSFEMKEINRPDKDERGEDIVVDELTAGKYDITCKAGPSYASQQSESIAKITELARFDPSIIQFGADVIAGGIGGPNMDKIAARIRANMINTGLIPLDQMTDDEKAQVAAAEAKQGDQPDAAMALAQAEQTKADAEVAKVQVAIQKNQLEMAKAQSAVAIQIEKLGLDRQKLQLDAQQRDMDFAEKLAKLDREDNQQEFDNLMALREQARETSNDAVNNLNTHVDSWKNIRETMGVDTFTGPGTTVAFINQSREVIDAQNET